MPNELSRRIYKYLESFGDGVWVPADTVRKAGKAKGYSADEIATALMVLDDMDDIGKVYKESKAHYCWYKLTDAQRMRMEAGRALWISL